MGPGETGAAEDQDLQLTHRTRCYLGGERQARAKTETAAALWTKLRRVKRMCRSSFQVSSSPAPRTDLVMGLTFSNVRKPRAP
jgi:hypothetical protein